MLILASGSPRRRELLTQMGIAYMVNPSNYREESPKKKEPEKFVQLQAVGKACDVAAKYPGQWVLGADTIVVADKTILGKPHSKKEASAMLHALSDTKHSVLTGVALVRDSEIHTKVVETKVWFRRLSDSEIDSYIESGEPMDKAGAYGIQGHAASFVDKINGSYTNVVGLPLSQVCKMLRKAKVDI
ncbi:nucleoside triphosphate pyrophosphatase [uncultured Megasphaera sp.]|uniref:Maf family protein n=1 Tax=uncultured Megasphaera sp. TaxID=165188 RepID=UPI0026595970|nr:Maf family protein [uncultured Megasphaera sp.]